MAEEEKNSAVPATEDTDVDTGSENDSGSGAPDVVGDYGLGHMGDEVVDTFEGNLQKGKDKLNKDVSKLKDKINDAKSKKDDNKNGNKGENKDGSKGKDEQNSKKDGSEKRSNAANKGSEKGADAAKKGADTANKAAGAVAAAVGGDVPSGGDTPPTDAPGDGEKKNGGGDNKGNKKGGGDEGGGGGGNYGAHQMGQEVVDDVSDKAKKLATAVVAIAAGIATAGVGTAAVAGASTGASAAQVATQEAVKKAAKKAGQAAIRNAGRKAASKTTSGSTKDSLLVGLIVVMGAITMLIQGVFSLLVNVFKMVINWVLSLFNSGDEGYSDDDFDTFMPNNEYKKQAKAFQDRVKEAYDDMIKIFDEDVNTNYSSAVSILVSGQEEEWKFDNIMGRAIDEHNATLAEDQKIGIDGIYTDAGHTQTLHNSYSNWYYPNASDYNATPGNHYYPQGLKLAAKDRTDSKTYVEGWEPYFDKEMSEEGMNDQSNGGELSDIAYLISAFNASRREKPISESESWIESIFHSYSWAIGSAEFKGKVDEVTDGYVVGWLWNKIKEAWGKATNGEEDPKSPYFNYSYNLECQTWAPRTYKDYVQCILPDVCTYIEFTSTPTKTTVYTADKYYYNLKTTHESFFLTGYDFNNKKWLAYNEDIAAGMYWGTNDWLNEYMYRDSRWHNTSTDDDPDDEYIEIKVSYDEGSGVSYYYLDIKCPNGGLDTRDFDVLADYWSSYGVPASYYISLSGIRDGGAIYDRQISITQGPTPDKLKIKTETRGNVKNSANLQNAIEAFYADTTLHSVTGVKTKTDSTGTSLDVTPQSINPTAYKTFAEYNPTVLASYQVSTTPPATPGNVVETTSGYWPGDKPKYSVYENIEATTTWTYPAYTTVASEIKTYDASHYVDVSCETLRWYTRCTSSPFDCDKLINILFVYGSNEYVKDTGVIDNDMGDTSTKGGFKGDNAITTYIMPNYMTYEKTTFEKDGEPVEGYAYIEVRDRDAKYDTTKYTNQNTENVEYYLDGEETTSWLLCWNEKGGIKWQAYTGTTNLYEYKCDAHGSSKVCTPYFQKDSEGNIKLDEDGNYVYGDQLHVAERNEDGTLSMEEGGCPGCRAEPKKSDPFGDEEKTYVTKAIKDLACKTKSEQIKNIDGYPILDENGEEVENAAITTYLTVNEKVLTGKDEIFRTCLAAANDAAGGYYGKYDYKFFDEGDTIGGVSLNTLVSVSCNIAESFKDYERYAYVSDNALTEGTKFTDIKFGKLKLSGIDLRSYLYRVQSACSTYDGKFEELKVDSGRLLLGEIWEAYRGSNPKDTKTDKYSLSKDAEGYYIPQTDGNAFYLGSSYMNTIWNGTQEPSDLTAMVQAVSALMQTKIGKDEMDKMLAERHKTYIQYFAKTKGISDPGAVLVLSDIAAEYAIKGDTSWTYNGTKMNSLIEKAGGSSATAIKVVGAYNTISTESTLRREKTSEYVLAMEDKHAWNISAAGAFVPDAADDDEPYPVEDVLKLEGDKLVPCEDGDGTQDWKQYYEIEGRSKSLKEQSTE